MRRSGVKNLSTVLVSFLVFLFLGSGVYNTFFVDFRISQSIFDDSKYTITVVDTLPPRQDKMLVEQPKKVRKIRKRLSYARRRPKKYQNAVKVKDPRETTTDKNEMAHIKSSLNLELVEFSNAKKFKKILKNGEVEGSLVANDGYIENLEIFLPDDGEITANFTEMNGNVFSYDHEGETYSGLIYQAGNSNYTVTLVNGPYQGSRMKFVSKTERALSYAEIIEEDNLERREEDQNMVLYEEDDYPEDDPQPREKERVTEIDTQPYYKDEEPYES